MVSVAPEVSYLAAVCLNMCHLHIVETTFNFLDDATLMVLLLLP